MLTREETRQADLLGRALAVTPGGSQTRSKAPGRVGPREARVGPFPLFADRGLGPFLFAGGKKYLDFAGANAAVPLGYAYPDVVDAVCAAVGAGNLLSLPTDTEVEVSEQFCRLVGAEQVRWVKTGSEALSAAVRIARAATGATGVVVARHSYHGWHDWTLARFDEDLLAGPCCLPNGVPSVLTNTVEMWDYRGDDELNAAVRRLHERGHRVAAVVVEPARFVEGQQYPLQVARRVADRVGAALVLDEMVYGFRWHVRGGAGYFDVRPDLQCFGKALGNGVPVACVCGSRRWMERAEQAFVSGTYGGDRLGLAAARAVMTVYEQRPVIPELFERGKQFWEECDAVWRSGGRSYRLLLEGFPVHWRVRWSSSDEADWVLGRCAEQGVLFHRDACNASAAMTPEHVRLGARVLAEAVVAWMDRVRLRG